MSSQVLSNNALVVLGWRHYVPSHHHRRSSIRRDGIQDFRLIMGNIWASVYRPLSAISRMMNLITIITIINRVFPRSFSFSSDVNHLAVSKVHPECITQRHSLPYPFPIKVLLSVSNQESLMTYERARWSRAT